MFEQGRGDVERDWLKERGLASCFNPIRVNEIVLIVMSTTSGVCHGSLGEETHPIDEHADRLKLTASNCVLSAGFVAEVLDDLDQR
jgi:hypothetical protein